MSRTRSELRAGGSPTPANLIPWASRQKRSIRASISTPPGRGAARGPGEGWSAAGARADVLRSRSVAAAYAHAGVLEMVLARAAGAARRRTYFDLVFPGTPQREPYWCFKHRRECCPVERAE